MALALSDMLAAIRTEIRQSSGAVSDADIKRKIFETIDSYKEKRFSFNEKEATFSTVVSQKEYVPGVGGVPADILHIESMTVLYGNRPLPMEPEDPQFIQRDFLLNTPSVPTHWSWHHSKLLLYPIPNSIYTIDIFYIADVSTFDQTSSAGTYTDPWFTTAERLIRNATKALIFGEFLRNPTEEERAINLAGRAFLDLKSRSSSIHAPFPVQPWGL